MPLVNAFAKQCPRDIARAESTSAKGDFPIDVPSAFTCYDILVYDFAVAYEMRSCAEVTIRVPSGWIPCLTDPRTIILFEGFYDRFSNFSHKSTKCFCLDWHVVCSNSLR